MATTIEILLNIKSAGESILAQLQKEVNTLKANLDTLRNTPTGGNQEESFKKMQAAADKAGASIKALVSSVGGNAPASSYLSGLSEGYSTVEKAALKAATTTEAFKKTLDSGGQGSAWALGIMDSLNETSTAAEDARKRLELINGVKTDGIKSEFNTLAEKLKGGLGSTEATAEIKKMGQSLEELKPQVVTNLGSAFSGLGGVIKLAAAAFAALKIKDYITDATLGAARTEVLGTVMHQMAKNAGIMTAEIDKVDKSVQKMGITAESSRESLSNMIRSGLDVSKYAAALARASQDLAVVSGENSSATLQRLITNISQLDTMGLRFMGITLDVTSAEEKYANSIGKTAVQLTQKQKIEAVTIGVLEEAKKMTGLYEASLENAGKAMSSLPRYSKELADSIGNLFLPALLEGIKGLTKFLSESKNFITGLDGSKEAADAAGSALHTFITVLGDVLSTIGSGLSILWDHRDALKAIAVIYGAGLGMSAIVGLAGGVLTALTTITGGLSAMAVAYGAMKTMTFAEMVLGIGTLVSKVPGMAAMGAAIEALGVSMVGASVAAKLLMATGVIAVIAGTAVMVYKATEAYLAMREAQESLAKSQGKFAKDLASTPQEAMDAWHNFSETLKKVAPAAGDSYDVLKKKGDELISAMTAGQKEYAAAYSKVVAGQGTKEQIKIVEDWTKKQLEATEAAKLVGKALRETNPAASEQATAFQKATNAALDLKKGFKDSAEYVTYFWKELNSLNDLSFAALQTSAEHVHSFLKAQLNVNPEINWDKVIAEDIRYYASTIERANSNRDQRKTLLDAEYADVKDSLNQKLIAAKAEGKEDLESTKRLNQLKAEESNRSIAIDKDALAQVTAARDQAEQAYIASLQKIASLKRELAQEDMSYEMKLFDLKTKLSQDAFTVKEKAIAERERSLAQNSALTAEQRAAEQKSIAAMKEGLAAERRADEANVQALISSKVSSLLAEARSKLQSGDLDGAKAANSAAEGLLGRLGTVQQQMDALTASHKVNQDIIAEKTKRATEDSKKQEEGLKSLTAVMNKLTDSIAQMAFQMEKTFMTTRMLQMSSELKVKTDDLADSYKELAKAQADQAKNSGTFGNKSDFDAASAKITEITKKIGDQEASVKSAREGIDQYSKTIDNLKAPKPFLENADIQTAKKGLDDIAQKASGISKEDYTMKLNVEDAQRAVDRFKRANPGYEVPVTADTKGFDNGVKKVKEAQGSIVKTWVVPITTQVDETPVTSLKQKLDEVGKITITKVTADTTEAKDAIDALAASAQATPDVAVKVTADDEAAKKDIQTLDDEKPAVVVDVTADTSEVDSAESAINAMRPSPTAIFEADDSEVTRAKQLAERNTESWHTIHVRSVQENANGGFINHLAGGGTPTRAMNSVTGAGSGTSDSILSLLSHGEFVLKAAAVSKYGLGQLYAMNDMTWGLPGLRLASGGAVSSPKSVQSIATMLNGAGLPTAARDVIDLNLNIGGKKHKVQSSRETATQLASALRELSRAG